MKATKEQIITLLYAWIKQRPGLEFGNYGEVKSYRAEMRSIMKDGREARTLLRAIELRQSITAERLVRAFKDAYSGRLSLVVDKKGARLDYVTGQYWPTEYRRAAAAVCASAYWSWLRDECMPKPKGTIKRGGSDYDSYDGVSAGDWLRNNCKKEFGRGIASRWFS